MAPSSATSMTARAERKQNYSFHQTGALAATALYSEGLLMSSPMDLFDSATNVYIRLVFDAYSALIKFKIFLNFNFMEFF